MAKAIPPGRQAWVRTKKTTKEWVGDVSSPTHVAIIMDGNGRWAQARKKPRTDGHRAGIGNVRIVVRHLAERNVRFVTLFAFSTENWSRPWGEVSTLLELLGQGIKAETMALHRSNVRILHMGRLDRLSSSLREGINEAIKLTKENTGLTLCVAFDYGGRDEIVQAARRIAAAGLPVDEINEEVFPRYLLSPSIPDPDLVIRTGGEFRMSNFLLWQSAYSEFYSTSVRWPDFDEAEIDNALEAYRGRKRRFGALTPEE